MSRPAPDLDEGVDVGPDEESEGRKDIPAVEARARR